MARKTLGKVVAGAALGGASLLLFSPGAAYAGGHAEYVGKVAAKPQVNLVEFCPGDGKDKDREDHDWEDRDRKGHDGKDHDGRDKDRRDHDGKADDGKDWDSNSDETGQPEADGQGGGMSADHSDMGDDGKDWDGKDRDKDRDKDRKDHCMPRGHVDGGDGGMTTTSVDRGLATGGASLIGAAALGGIALMRRRRADELV